MADTYNMGATIPALFAAHEERYKKAGEEIDRLRAENESLRKIIQDWLDCKDSRVESIHRERARAALRGEEESDERSEERHERLVSA